MIYSFYGFFDSLLETLISGTFVSKEFENMALKKFSTEFS